ncbi:MAG: hypothetical protein QM677_04840 [Microbacterium sp.]
MSELELAPVVVSTICTICMIGLGFLYRPSRATLVWSLTFVLVMVCTYVAMIATQTDDGALHVGATGALLVAPALIWSGLRAHRGARGNEWIGVISALALSFALPVSSETDAYPWVFRVAFAATAAFAALAVVELMRRPDRGGGTSMPLTVFSVGLVSVALVSLVAGVIIPAEDPLEAFAFLRAVNALGLLAYLVCVLISLLFIARGGTAGGSGHDTFREVAADRLARAHRVGERSWALVYVQLDDADDLRTIAGDAGFTALSERLRSDIVEQFPTEADIGRLGPAGYVVLVSQPTAVIRDRVRTLLRTVTTPQNDTRVGASASVGWAGVTEYGYDLDALVEAARAAADRAAEAGGDRWERARG